MRGLLTPCRAFTCFTCAQLCDYTGMPQLLAVLDTTLSEFTTVELDRVAQPLWSWIVHATTRGQLMKARRRPGFVRAERTVHLSWFSTV